MMIRSLLVSIFFCSVFSAFRNPALAAPLNLSEYLKQVETGDPGLRSANLARESAKLGLRNFEAPTAVRVTGQFGRTKDGRPTLNPSFQGEQTWVETYSVGLQQQSPWGPIWALKYNWMETEIRGRNLILSTPNFYDVYPSLELTLPLWRNSWGSEVRAQRDQLRSQTQALDLQRRAEWAQRSKEAELSYWQTANLRERLKIQQDNLERANRLFQWTQTRRNRDLAQDADLLQAQAAVELRRLDLLQTQQELRTAERNFNRLRNSQQESVSEELQFLTVNVAEVKPVSPTAQRLDQLAQQKLMESRAASARSLAESASPSLNLVGQFLRQGRDNFNYTEAQGSLRSNQFEQWFLGVQFSAPLDFSLIRDQLQSARLEERAADQEIERSTREMLNSSQNFSDLGTTLANSLQLVRQLERTQFRKVEEERLRLNRGKTILAQVLMFEQDYANVRSQRLGLELQVRQWLAQRSLFE